MIIADPIQHRRSLRDHPHGRAKGPWVLEGGFRDGTMAVDLPQINSCASQSHMLHIGFKETTKWHRDRVGTWRTFVGLSVPSRDTSLGISMGSDAR